MPNKRRSTRSLQSTLDFRRLEPRQLLAALASGQEVSSSIVAGGSESFEIEASAGQRVSISVGEIGNFGQPALTVLGPAGTVLGTHTTADDTAEFTFNANQDGVYTAVVTDDGNDQNVSFRIRALFSPGPIELISGRDQVLSNGQEATATVPLGGFNVFPFDAVAGQRVNISVGEIDNFGQPFLTILDPAGMVSGTNTDADDTAALTFNAAQTGTYTAIVTDDGNDQSVSFRIRSLTSPGPVELLPGRDQALASGEEATATVPVGGFNVFPFEATPGQRLSVSVGEIGSSGQPFLTILGPAGTVLGTDTAADDTAALTFIATQAGTYTAIVTDDGNDQGFSFRIRALTSPGTVELLPGRDQALADGDEATSMVPVGGFNLFPFEATSGQQVNVSVNEIGNFGQPFLTILGTDGIVLGTNTNSADAAALTFNATQAGTYTAIVTDDGNDQGFSFRITATGITQLPPGIIRFERDGETDARISLLERPDQLGVASVSFNQDVDLSASDFTFFNETTQSAVVVPAQVYSYDDATFTAKWDFTTFLPTLFPSGFYKIFASKSAITATSDGRSLVDDFSKQVLVALPGDLNLDGKVDVLGDAFGLVGDLGLTGTGTWGSGDFNGNGNVDVLGDAFILIGRLGQTVIPVSPASTVLALPIEKSPDAGTAPIVFTDLWVDDHDDEVKNAAAVLLDQVFAGEKDLLELV